jgi:hypothetical protein
MKALLSLLTFIVVFNAFSQTIPPPYINYQATLYDVSGPNPNAPYQGPLTAFINITNELGTLIYQEEHFVTSDQNGLVTIKMGDGLYVAGTVTIFNNIPWTVNKYYLTVDFVIGGITSSTAPEQLVTVPYAFHAGTAGTSLDSWSKMGNASTSPSTNFIGTTDAQDFVVRTNNLERMRVTSTGNIGIGTSNPLAKFDINNDISGSDSSFVVTQNGNTGIGTNFPSSRLHMLGTSLAGQLSTLQSLSSTLTIEAANPGFHNGALLFISSHITANKRGNGIFLFNQNGQNEWFVGRPYAGNAISQPNDEFVIQRLATNTHNEEACALTDGNGNPTATQRFFVVKNNGLTGIGTNAPDQLLSVNGNASKVGGGSWATFSDKRVKRDINSFTDGLNVLMQLKPVTFRYNEKSGYSDLDKSYVGFIAQEVEQIAPYMVERFDDSKGPSGLSDKRQFDESALNKILVNAVKEQQKKIEQLEEMLQKQQLHINQLSSDLKSVMNNLSPQSENVIND